jgi:hypothetical protein
VNSAALTDAVKGSGSVGAEPQQAIEDTQEFARGQRRHVAEVEQQCPPAETEIDETAPGSEKGSLTRRGCTSQVTSSPFSFRPHGHAAVAA